MVITIANDTVNIDGEIYVKEKQKNTLVDCFNAYHGVKEYDGIVASIQRWYYGSLVKASWCATSLSYFANECGLLDAIGGKNENVYLMMIACLSASKKGYGKFYTKAEIPQRIKKNDILFWLWSGTVMNTASQKHVGVAEYDSTDDYVYCLGGNQKDKICTLQYMRNKLYAVYRIGG